MNVPHGPPCMTHDPDSCGCRRGTVTVATLPAMATEVARVCSTNSPIKHHNSDVLNVPPPPSMLTLNVIGVNVTPALAPFGVATLLASDPQAVEGVTVELMVKFPGVFPEGCVIAV